jgi:transposase
LSKYSVGFKLEVAKAYLDGVTSYAALGQRWGVDRSKVRLWVKLYRAHGSEGLARKFTHYSAAFKLSVLQRMWADSLSFYDTAAIFNIRNPSCLAQWERLYRQGGIEALRPRKRGKPKAMSDPKGEPPPGERPDTERSQEDLIAELKQLRMENAYLKKLDALVRARQAPKGRK